MCACAQLYRQKKKRRAQLELSWWWYNCIFVRTDSIWVSGEDLKFSCAARSILSIDCIITLITQGIIRRFKKLSRYALSIWYIGCIRTMTTQVNIRRPGKLLRGCFHNNHWSYRYVKNTGKYQKIWKSLAWFFSCEPLVVSVSQISLKKRE